MAVPLQSRLHPNRKVLPYVLAAAGLVLLGWRPIRGLAGQTALALLLTAICLPLQKQLEKKIKPGIAALISVIGVVCLLAGVIVLAAPQLIRRITALVSQIPELMRSAEDIWQQISQADWFRALNLQSNLPQTWLNRLQEFILAETPRLISGIAGSIEKISRAFLAPVLSYYFLRDRAYLCYQISLWIPVRYRKTSLKMLREMKRETESYLRGQLMISLAVMVLTAGGLMLLGIPSWPALGIIMGICELIPYIGPLIGGIPVVLFSLPLGLNKTLWAVILVIVVQQLEGYFLSPRLMAGAVSLHPVYVLLLLTAGGLTGGLLGMMAAIPLFVCLRGALRVIYVEKQERKVVKIIGNDKV